MTLEIRQLARDERRLFAIAGAMGAHDLSQAALVLAFLRDFGDVSSGSPVDSSRFAVILDDLGLPISNRSALRVLSERGIVEMGADGEVHLAKGISSTKWFGSGAGSVMDEFTLGELRELLGPARPISRGVSADVTGLLAAVERGQQWALEIMAESRNRGLPGLPVFWNCSDEGHRPFSTDPGTMATTDGVLLLASAPAAGFNFPSLTGGNIESVEWIWKRVLDLQVVTEGWDEGAIRLDVWDDDFVGTFLPELADRGSCPTVDATGNALVAVCTLLDSGVVTQLDSVLGTELRRRSVLAAENAVACLLRWQQPDGAWPIYSYDPLGKETWLLPPRDFSCRYAGEALCRAAKSVPSTASAAAKGLARLGEFLRDRLVVDGPHSHWDADFVPTDDDAALRATATLAPLLDWTRRIGVPVADVGVERSVHLYLASRWQPAPSRYTRVEFRVPTWRGPAPAKFPWELPADPMIVSALLAGPVGRGVVDAPLAGHLLAAASGFLERELHGHWVDFLMEEEGDVRAMTGNSIHYHRALIDYMTWQASLLPPNLLGEARP